MPVAASTKSDKEKDAESHGRPGKAPRLESFPERDAGLLGLQRAAGNQAVGLLLDSKSIDSEERGGESPGLAGTAADLPIGQPGNRFEREADTAADHAVNWSGRANRQNQIPSRESQSGSHRQTAKEVSGLPGSAEPLPSDVRATLEPRLGFDLGGVRIRKDGPAAVAAKEMGAHAFTAGRDIVFGAGEYAPNTTAGQRLLAHELAHVAQQGKESGSPGGGPQLSAAPTQIQGSFFGDVWEGIKSGAKAVGGAIVSGAKAVGGAIATGAKAVGKFVSGAAKWIGERLHDASQWVVNLIRDLPARLARLATTIFEGLKGIVTFIPEAIMALKNGGLKGFASWLWEKAKSGGAWLLTLVSRMFDVMGGPEIVEFILHLVTKARALTAAEIAAASSVLGSTAIRWEDVRVDEGGVLAVVFALNNSRAFTTFHTINLPPNEPMDTVVHELTHVFQYERAGSVYLGEAIHAQATIGYGYGDGAGLVTAKNSGKHYRDFNREQQAQIAQDYYKRVIIAGGASLPADELSAYNYFIGELRAGDL
jgi:Domain of unknown function (DUF4157)